MIQAPTYPSETILSKKRIRRCCMKPIVLVGLLVGLVAPSCGQQQLCFSENCAQTPATMFTLDRSNKQLANIFRPSPVLPDYTPVSPLASSRSTREFFQYSTPTNVGHESGLAELGNATEMVEPNHGSMTGIPSPAGQSGSHPVGPMFSTGQGGIAFTPASPKF